MGNKQNNKPIVSLKDLPYTHAKAAVINDNFVIIPMYRKGKEDYNHGAGIYCYDFNKNRWNELIKYPNDLEMSCRAYQYYSESNTLQIYSDIRNTSIKIFNINLSTKEWNILDTKCLNDDGVSMYIIINDELHIIGKSKHCIWCMKSQKITQIFIFDDLPSNVGFQSIVYLKHKQVLFVFGGYSEDTCECIDDIYLYYLKDKEWKKAKATLPKKLHLMAIVASKDEKYIMLFGGWAQADDGSLDSNDIFVYNVEDDTVFQSKICCPSKGQYRAIIWDNNIKIGKVTKGYIRTMTININIFVPKEIVLIIHSMCVVQYVHLMKDKKHWRIYFDAILKRKQIETMGSV